MTIKNFTIKNSHLIFVLLGLIIIFIVLISFTKKTGTKAIVPGKSTISTVLSDQVPFLTKDGADGKEYYVGEQTSSNYSVYVEKDDHLSHYIEKNPADFSHSTIDEYFTEFGKNDIELYGPWYNGGGYMSYIFLKPGLIIVAHPISKLITEIWHIPPNLTKAQFNTSFNSSFTSTPPPVPTQF